MAANIGHETLVCCHELLVSDISGDPEQMAGILFQHRFITEGTKDKLNELDKSKTHKARLIADNIERKVKSYPEFYEKFLAILREPPLQYVDLVKALGEEYEKVSQKATAVFESYPVALTSQLSATMQPDIPEITGLPELPTADDMGTVPDPLENPPDSEEVGRDIRAAAVMSQKEIPNVDLLEGKLLKALQSGVYTEAIELLSQAETQVVDLRSVCDSDGKTLLHLACRKHFLDWYPVVESLVGKHDCDVSAVDEDGNTPLHDAYQCGNMKVFSYLLSLPKCNPDALNKHEFTVLRMALQKNDIPTTRALLATGRVDPRRGSPRGHTYHEVMEMDGTLLQDINDSALQIVTKCAECIEYSSLVHPNFAAHYLLDVLFIIFENRDSISINGIVERIKENKAPLPEDANKIHDLLIGLSDKIEICRHKDTLEYGSIQIKKKGSVCLNRDQPSDEPDTSLEHTIEEQPSNDADETDNDTNLIEDNTEPLNTQQLLPDSRPSTTIQNPPNSDQNEEASENVSNSPKNSPSTSLLSRIGKSLSIQEKTKKRLSIILLTSFALIALASLIPINYFANSIAPYSPVSSTSVVHMRQPSVPLIEKSIDINLYIRLQYTTNGAINFPVIFYILQNCSAEDSFLNREVDETVEIFFNSKNSKSLSEWYFLANTTLTVTITTDVLPNYPADHCIAFIVVFDDFYKFTKFITSSLKANYYFMECITNTQFQTKNLTFGNQSYYFLGLYSDNSTEIGTFVIHTTGLYLEYNTLDSTTTCSTDSTTTTCDFSSSELTSFSEDSCLVGLVSATNQVTAATVDLSTSIGFRLTVALGVGLSSGIMAVLILVCQYVLCIVSIRNSYKKKKENVNVEKSTTTYGTL